MGLTKKTRKVRKGVTKDQLPEPYPFKKESGHIDEDKLPAKFKESNEMLKKAKLLP